MAEEVAPPLRKAVLVLRAAPETFPPEAPRVRKNATSDALARFAAALEEVRAAGGFVDAEAEGHPVAAVRIPEGAAAPRGAVLIFPEGWG